jgi:hypothetical protein
MRRAGPDIRSACAVIYRAGAEGIEPPTSGFGDRRSAKLSYTPRGPLSAGLFSFSYKRAPPAGTWFLRAATGVPVRLPGGLAQERLSVHAPRSHRRVPVAVVLGCWFHVVAFRPRPPDCDPV